MQGGELKKRQHKQKSKETEVEEHTHTHTSRGTVVEAAMQSVSVMYLSV